MKVAKKLPGWKACNAAWQGRTTRSIEEVVPDELMIMARDDTF